MPARKRSRTRVKAKRASNPWTHPKAEIAFREINDGRRRFNVPLYTREDIPPGALFDRLKIFDENERWRKRKQRPKQLTRN